MRSIWQDLRFGVRMLGRSRGLTAIALLALALGIGANTAIFSIVDAVLLRSFPYPDANQLVVMFDVPLKKPDTLSGRIIQYWRKTNRVNVSGANWLNGSTEP